MHYTYEKSNNILMVKDLYKLMMNSSCQISFNHLEVATTATTADDSNNASKVAMKYFLIMVICSNVS